MKKSFNNVQRGSTTANLVVNDIRVVAVDRTMKDIQHFKDALISAESVYYPNRTRLYDLYDHVTLDGHLTGIIGKRIDAVLNKNLIVQDANKKQLDEFEDLLKTEVFRDICQNILLTKFYGCTGLEFVVGNELKFEEIPRKHIKIEKQVIAINQNEYDGTTYQDNKLIWVIGKKNDFGLLLKCSVYALYKKNGFGDFAQYVEIFGQPVRVFRYDANDLQTKKDLQNVADNSAGSLALLIPKQAEFEMLDGKLSNSDGQLQERLLNRCNDEMSVVVLGNTETTSNNNGGSNAKTKEHGKQQLEITKSDMAYLLSQLNTQKFFDILKSYGININGKFHFEKEIDLASLSQKIIIDTTIKNSGTPIDDSHFYETYGIAKPANYNELKKKMEEDNKASKPNNPKPKTKDQKPKTENALSFIDTLRASIADFFDPAHKD